MKTVRATLILLLLMVLVLLYLIHAEEANAEITRTTYYINLPSGKPVRVRSKDDWNNDKYIIGYMYGGESFDQVDFWITDNGGFYIAKWDGFVDVDYISIDPPHDPIEGVITTIAKTNVRRRPSANPKISAVVTTVKQGKKVRILGRMNGIDGKEDGVWYYVEINGKAHRWVRTDLVSLEEITHICPACGEEIEPIVHTNFKEPA